MFKKLFITILSIILACSFPVISFAHSGRTDANGGHWDRKAGTYHYHNGGYSDSDSDSSYYSYTKSVVHARKINKVTIPKSIEAGQGTQLECEVYPSNAEEDTISWYSETPEIATVSLDGYLEAHGVGTAVIVAKTSNGVSSTFKIEIKEIVATSMKIENRIDEIALSDTHSLNVSFSPENATYKDIVWTSSNEEIVKILEDGTLSAVNVGTATITASHKNLKDSFEIEVLPIKAESIEIKENGDFEKTEGSETLKINQEGTGKLSAVITPYNTTDKSIEWSVDDENIATVDKDGNLKINSIGTITVTAKTENGKTDTLVIEIYSDTSKAISSIVVIVIIVTAIIIYFKLKRKSKS